MDSDKDWYGTSTKLYYGGEVRVCNCPPPKIEALDKILDLIDMYVDLKESIAGQ